MKPQQLILDKRLIRQSKQFLRQMYESDKIEGARIFDYLDGTTMRRRSDETMNLEEYLHMNWSHRHVRLQISSPTPDRIIYCAAIYREVGGVTFTRFAWLDGPLTEENVQEVARIYKESYMEEL